MAISEIIKDIDYDLPDDIYHQTNELGNRAYVKYKGPSKIHVWINSITNKIQGIEIAPQGEMMFNGEMPLPQGDHYLVEVDAEEDMTQAVVCAMFGGVDPLSIPDVEETVLGQTSTYVRDKYPLPDHTYERDEIEYSPTSDSFITPFPWRKPITTWPEKLEVRDRALANSDRLNSEDLPSGAKTLVQNYQKYLRDITETVGVAWTATVPTGGTGYAVGDVLLVQDPKYKNTNVVDEVKITVTAKSGTGAITGFSVENKRALYHPEAATHTDCFFVTNGSGTGAKVTLTKVKQVDPWKVEWQDQPLLTIHGEGNKLARKDDDIVTNTEDAKVRAAAEATFNPAHELAVE